MQMLFYAKNGAGENILNSIESLFSEVEVFRSMIGLSARFRQPLEDPTITVLIAQTREELENLLLIRDLLRDVRIVLVLPDRDAETIAKGHVLQPRFFSYLDADAGQVNAVLKKMLDNALVYPNKKEKLVCTQC